MISLVVPNLNEEQFLGKFLSSLAAQNYHNFELIIVDGGSTDGSREVVDRFQELHPWIPITKLLNKRRNIGFIRNFGSRCARGELLFHTSSDVMLDPWILNMVSWFFYKEPSLMSLTGRTKPVSSRILPHIAYQGFDLLRWFFTKLPGAFRKYRPGGNFFVIRSDLFWKVGGFPEVCINEDGLLGQKLDELIIKSNHQLNVRFNLGMCVYHHVKRFEERGSLKTILFYLYVFGNLFPMLKPFLYKIESHSAEVFKSRSDLRNFS